MDAFAAVLAVSGAILLCLGGAVGSTGTLAAGAAGVIGGVLLQLVLIEADRRRLRR